MPIDAKSTDEYQDGFLQRLREIYGRDRERVLERIRGIEAERGPDSPLLARSSSRTI